MQTTAKPTNNSATPEALRQYIPDHLLDPNQRGNYENARIAVELMVRGIDLSVETSPASRTEYATIRVSTGEFGQHLDAKGARLLAQALLQLADVHEELTLDQQRATSRATNPFTNLEQHAAGLAVECFGADSSEALRMAQHIVQRSGKTWLTDRAPADPTTAKAQA